MSSNSCKSKNAFFIGNACKLKFHEFTSHEIIRTLYSIANGSNLLYLPGFEALVSNLQSTRSKETLVNWIPDSRAAEAKVITLSALSSVCFDLQTCTYNKITSFFKFPYKLT